MPLFDETTTPDVNSEMDKESMVADANSGEEKVKEPKRVPMDVSGCQTDEDGRLLEVPTDFNYRKTLPLRKQDFAQEFLYIRYQGIVAKQKSEFYAVQSEERMKRADQLAKFGDEKTRKRAAKLQKMKDQMKALEAELAKDGYDMEEILGE